MIGGGAGLLYPSLEEFYAEDERRRRFGGEVDFGTLWLRGSAGWPTYRVSFVIETGELYAVRLGGGARGGVELLGSCESREEAERRLDGWPEACGRPGGLEWVRARLGGAS